MQEFSGHLVSSLFWTRRTRKRFNPRQRFSEHPQLEGVQPQLAPSPADQPDELFGVPKMENWRVWFGLAQRGQVTWLCPRSSTIFSYCW